MIKRKGAKVIKIGNLKIGGNFPILVQSMTNTKTADIEATLKQIKKLESAGCEIIRVGVPDLKSAKAIFEIKKRTHLPLVADIHFSSALAIESIKQGADKIRINPGNFPKEDLKEIVTLARKKKIPIRIGINSGSLEKDILGKHKMVTAEMMVKSALRNVQLVEKLGFYDLVVSLKAPDVLRTAKAYEMLSEKLITRMTMKGEKETCLFDYPLHLGITEAGGEFSGSIKSAIGIGYLLLKGIGDTIRVSLSDDPVKEVKVGWEILKSLELRERGVKIVSCPTCARTSIDVIGLTKKIEKITQNIKKFTQHRNEISGAGPLRIAIMGCLVNGLGEGREANLAIVGAGKITLIMREGKIIKKIRGKRKIFEIFRQELKKKNLI